MATLAELKINDELKFRSKIASDNNLYHGVIVSFCNYKLAKAYEDIYTINTNAKVADNTVPDVPLLDFMIIELLSTVDGKSKFLIPFAKQWINEATLDIIQTQSRLDITVFDAGSNDVADILALLRGAGFKASVVKAY